jgi:hypothetical protein
MPRIDNSAVDGPVPSSPLSPPSPLIAPVATSLSPEWSVSLRCRSVVGFVSSSWRIWSVGPPMSAEVLSSF